MHDDRVAENRLAPPIAGPTRALARSAAPRAIAQYFGTLAVVADTLHKGKPSDYVRPGGPPSSKTSKPPPENAEEKKRPPCDQSHNTGK